MTKAQTLTAAAVEDGVPALVEARGGRRFPGDVRAMAPDRLEGGLLRAGPGLVASFARGVGQDRAAVLAAIPLPWSNGQTGGQITKRKLVKRPVYDRGRIDLSHDRLIGFASR